MDYIAAGMTITNDVVFADGTTSKRHMGGSAFALEGIRQWTDSVLYVSNVGPDFPDYYGEWFKNNGLSMDGVRFTMPHTHYNIVKYFPDHQYYEYSIYGETYIQDQAKNWMTTPEQILEVCDGVKGIYLDVNVYNSVWKKGIPFIQEKGCKVMWEIPAYVKNPEHHDRIWETIDLVDIYSLNLPESKILFGTENEEQAIERILEIGKPCFYRVGSKGSYMIMDGQVAFAPSIDIGEPVDPTGCGNCSTASALYCWCEGYDPLMICIMSNIAAAHNILQYGLYPQFTPEVIANAHALAEDYYKKLKTEE